ncbi:protein of unknown function [Pseudomonas sp. JV241A]|nr:protein of unknown function [Pseudomonas sp. JV241A]
MQGALLSEDGRGKGIRTPDILLPKQARYRTALYPGKKKAPIKAPFLWLAANGKPTF